MSTSCRQQALIEAPIESVWELIGDPQRYPDWWPRMVEVRGSKFDPGDEFAAITESPLGSSEMQLVVDSREEPRELHIHCTISGAYFGWALTEAQGGTFLEAEFGIQPASAAYRLMDLTIGRRYFRSWLNASIEGLTAATRASPG